MKLAIFQFIFIFALAVCHCSAQVKDVPKKQVLSSMCQILSVPEGLKKSGSDFTQSYTFKVDKDGKPFEVKRAGVKLVADENEVHSCLADWKISGFPETTSFHLSFRWKHNVGWVRMILFTRLGRTPFVQITINGNAKDAGIEIL